MKNSHKIGIAGGLVAAGAAGFGGAALMERGGEEAPHAKSSVSKEINASAKPKAMEYNAPKPTDIPKAVYEADEPKAEVKKAPKKEVTEMLGETCLVLWKAHDVLEPGRTDVRIDEFDDIARVANELDASADKAEAEGNRSDAAIEDVHEVADEMRDIQASGGEDAEALEAEEKLQEVISERCTPDV